MPQYAFTQKTVKYLGEPNIRLVTYLILCCSQEQRKINSIRTLETPKGGIGDINSVAGRWFSSKIFNYFNKYLPLSSEISSVC